MDDEEDWALDGEEAALLDAVRAKKKVRSTDRRDWEDIDSYTHIHTCMHTYITPTHLWSPMRPPPSMS